MTNSETPSIPVEGVITSSMVTRQHPKQGKLQSDLEQKKKGKKRRGKKS